MPFFRTKPKMTFQRAASLRRRAFCAIMTTGNTVSKPKETAII